MLYSELDSDRHEVRKVEQYANGHLDYADATRETGTTFLSEAPIPLLDEIADQEEFTPVEITQETFEMIWRRATSNDHH